MEETEYFLASQAPKNLHRASLGSNEMISGEKNIQIILLRSQECPLSFLGGHNGDMEEMGYFLASQETKNLHRTSLESNKMLDLTVSCQRCLEYIGMNKHTINSHLVSYSGRTLSHPCLHHVIQGSYKDVPGSLGDKHSGSILVIKSIVSYAQQIQIVTLSLALQRN